MQVWYSIDYRVSTCRVPYTYNLHLLIGHILTVDNSIGARNNFTQMRPSNFWYNTPKLRKPRQVFRALDNLLRNPSSRFGVIR